MPAPAEDRGDLTNEQKLQEIEQPDAKLATEIPDEADRQRKITEAFGGEVDDDLDDDDFEGADRGDNLETESKSEDRGDEVKSEEAAEGEAEASDDDPEKGSDDDSADESTEEADADSDSDSGEEGDSADEDDDVDATEDEDEDEKAEKAEKGIPRHRFNEVNERMKQAEARLAELESTGKAKEDAAENKFDFDAAEAVYMELLLDGKTTEAGAKRAEIRAAEREAFKTETKQETVEEVDQAAEMRDLTSLTVQAEEMFPVFDQNHEDYNATAAAKVITWMRGYTSSGKSPSDAFVAALTDAIDLYGLDTKYGETKDEEPESDPKPKVTKKAPIKKVDKKLKAAEQQGASPAQAGKGSTEAGAAVPDIEQLSDEEIEALPAETLARLRGDYI